MNKIKWCFSVKGGLKFIEPNKELAVSYLNEAEKTLSKINQLINEEDFLWASVRIYYCAYYSIYSFLQKIGVKSENHDCAIELIKEFFSNDLLKNIDKFKEDRISSQYYLKTGQKNKLNDNYFQVKEFYLKFKKVINEISEEDVKDYRNKLNEMLK